MILNETRRRGARAGSGRRADREARADRPEARSRRRGEALETALVEAAWAELVEKGYAGLTFDGVARRAGTSRPVVYRRWATKAEIVVAAVRHNSIQHPIEMPDTGTLRGDIIAVMEAFMNARADAVAVMTVGLAPYYEETGTTMADLRRAMLAGRADRMAELLERAATRGEVDLARITPRMASLPLDLARNELVMTLKPIAREVIEEIVDTLWLPLLRPRL